MEQERLHREMLREHLREEKLNSLKLKVKIVQDLPCLYNERSKRYGPSLFVCVCVLNLFLSFNSHFQSKQWNFSFFFLY